MYQLDHGQALLLSVGDLILDEPNPDSFFDPCRATLRTGDFVLGQVEVPHTDRGVESSTDIPAPPSDPEHLKALQRCGFNLCSVAGNHAHDNGVNGIVDTRRHLSDLGIANTGTGLNLAQAKTPAIVEKKGIRVGLLSYNATGPRQGWATSNKAGCAYVDILTHYEPAQASPGSPALIYTFPEPKSMAQMQADIRALRPQCDVLCVSLHKGVGHFEETIQMYEIPLSRAAVDAGADVVFGHHAHIQRGIELYEGKPIYHGMGNFVTVTHALTPSGENNSPERMAWAEKRKKLFGFAPDPNMPFYPFHPESRKTYIAALVLSKTGVVQAGYLPCQINDAGAPEVLTDLEKAQPVLDYMEKITRSQKLKCTMTWDDGWVKLDEEG